MIVKRILLLFVLASSLVAPVWAQSDTKTALQTECAPYALYPDTLLAQVLSASTYPDQVAEASTWCLQNPGLTGAELSGSLSAETWEPSVKALCSFPTVLQKMTSDLQGTTALGQSFLADQATVMECVQSLRAQAQSMGALASNAQQKVVTSNSVIQILPAQTDVIYVPTYNPTYLYGDSDYNQGDNLLSFGAGIAMGSLLFDNYGAFDWANHGLYMGSVYRAGAYTGAYRFGGATAWTHGAGYAGGYGRGVYHTGTTGIHTGPLGTTAYHTGVTAGAGYRGYGAARTTGVYHNSFSGGYDHAGGFAGSQTRFASRGYSSFGGVESRGGGFGGAHFGGGFRR